MDVVTFLGPRIPDEVKKLFTLLQKLKQEVVEGILDLVVQFLKEDITEEQFDSTAQELKLDKQTLSIVFGGLLILVRGAVRSRVKLDQLQKDLQELRSIPQYLAQDVIKILKEK